MEKTDVVKNQFWDWIFIPIPGIYKLLHLFPASGLACEGLPFNRNRVQKQSQILLMPEDVSFVRVGRYFAIVP